MATFGLFLLSGIGLAMDAFAVCICKGLSMKKVKFTRAAVIALFMGGFQALMPSLGWLLGSRFEQYIKNYDHWIAFVLLGIIGGKMLFEALTEKDRTVETAKTDYELNIKELFVLAFATSIDALAVGISFACLNYSILHAVAVIGTVTFIIALAGVYIGNFFGIRFKRKAEIAGGVILILIGLKILLEHLNII
ncbi:MAG: manganese efflux pump [Clostridia bacterium]|nr:manganese efflux pump [Clostridia bacterium]